MSERLCYCTRPSLTRFRPSHICTIPPTPTNPLTPAPHGTTIASQWRPAATHEPHTLPAAPGGVVQVMRAPREVRALEAGAWRRVPRRGCDRARPAAMGRPPRRPAQLSSSGATPRLQRPLCFLNCFAPCCPFMLQPHLHAAVTLQQNVARSATGRRGVSGLVGGQCRGVARRETHLHARGPCCTWRSGTARLPCAPATRRGFGRERGGRKRQHRRV